MKLTSITHPPSGGCSCAPGVGDDRSDEDMSPGPDIITKLTFHVLPPPKKKEGFCFTNKNMEVLSLLLDVLSW